MNEPVYRSERTKETYERALRQLRAGLGAPASDMEFLRDANGVVKYVESLQKSVNTRKIFYIAIVSRLKGNPQFADVFPTYKKKQDEYNRAVGAQMERQQLSPAETEKFVPWPEVLKAREAARLAAYDLMTYQDYVLACLYTYLPPARLDYSPMQVVSEDISGAANYLLVLPSGLTLVLNSYKTAHKYGQQRTAVPPALEAILREWLTLNPSGWLLCNTDGSPMSEGSLAQRITAVFKKHTGKAVGVCMLRHSFVSWFRRREAPLLRIAEIARQMGHSVGMNALYRKLNTN